MSGKALDKVLDANTLLVDENRLLKNDIKELKRTIKNAINYIEERNNLYGLFECVNNKELLKILKGSDFSESINN